mgnify:CR=1 FL=1
MIKIKTKKYLDLLEELNQIAEKYNINLYETTDELCFKKLELFEYEYLEDK